LLHQLVLSRIHLQVGHVVRLVDRDLQLDLLDEFLVKVVFEVLERPLFIAKLFQVLVYESLLGASVVPRALLIALDVPQVLVPVAIRTSFLLLLEDLGLVHHRHGQVVSEELLIILPDLDSQLQDV